MSVVPALEDTPGFGEALAFITDAYGTRVTRAGRTVKHRIAVAELLSADGQPQSTIVTGLLHDVLEDTGVPPGELHEWFGQHVGCLVQALTQDTSIEKYGLRKAALRRRIIDAGREAATVSLADKAAKLDDVKARPARRKLAHYRATLAECEESFGCSRLSTLLRERLRRWPEG